jgi:hypothetical protein
MRRIIFALFVLTLVILACNISGSPAPTEPISPATVTLTIYFTDMARYQVGTEPYETAVTRTLPAPVSLPEEILTQLFQGPTDAEKAQGLAVILSGTTGFSNLTVENGIARVFLSGTCASNGATYTIANLIHANLQQFPEIQWVKIYDENNGTEAPSGQSDSIPFCLEP